MTAFREPAPPVLPCDVRKGVHQPGKISTHYGSDVSGTVTYALNSMGFRGEDYDPQAKFRLCVVGESHALGTGLAMDRTFGHLLKCHIATAFNLAMAQVNHLNFSIGSAPADFCVRMLYRQPVIRQSDLVVVNFPAPDRIEYFKGTTGLFYNPSALTDEDLQVAPDSLLGFVEMYNPHMGQLNYVKNILMAQSALREFGVDHILSVQHLAPGKTDFATDFLPAIDDLRTYRHQVFRDRLDLAADGSHGGPRCHALVALGILVAYGRLLFAQGSPKKAQKIAAVAAELCRLNPDWARYAPLPGGP
jgi:hypothetical protein